MSQNLRKEILSLHKKCESYKKIGKAFHIIQNTLAKVIQKFRKAGNEIILQRCPAHPRKLTFKQEPSLNASLESSAAASIAQTVTERIGELMEEKFLDLRSTLDRLNGRIDDNTRRITESENRISEDEDRITSLENQVSELQQKVKTLTERCDDGENRSRRENIRIIGLKEGSEGQSSVTFFESWLPEVLGMETKRGVIKLDRAHRALGPPKEDRCRPVIIKLHNFTDKQRILTAAREKGEIIYKGSRIYIRQDFSAQVREARQKFNGTCQRLIKGGVRFSMRYPATLCFSLKGAERSFRSAQAAEEFLDKNGLK
uniref:L1 transposable element RRM domain-containing protein n=1 Tax=Oryzias latipes TaxID=8090 RepID=A0A3P9L4D9_ORYLA